MLDLTGIPGHQAASLLVYDRWTGLLFTGDSVYPGRLYVPDFPAFVDSMRRAVDFAGGARGDARARLPHRDDAHALAATTSSAAPTNPTSRRCR